MIKFYQWGPAHMLHNTAKHGLDRCKFDVETLVLKVYSHFCIHVKQKTKELKTFFLIS